mmetsp:Transcript_13822/g.18467  ORF Transcript_13822/g.18467 Transcript_13822/m.18467 type:complete len:249 (+) Transcript_13822:385-1131(+)
MLLVFVIVNPDILPSLHKKLPCFIVNTFGSMVPFVMLNIMFPFLNNLKNVILPIVLLLYMSMRPEKWLGIECLHGARSQVDLFPSVCLMPALQLQLNPCVYLHHTLIFWHGYVMMLMANRLIWRHLRLLIKQAILNAFDADLVRVSMKLNFDISQSIGERGGFVLYLDSKMQLHFKYQIYHLILHCLLLLMVAHSVILVNIFLYLNLMCLYGNMPSVPEQLSLRMQSFLLFVTPSKIVYYKLLKRMTF